MSREILKKIYFLKAIGYKFIDKNSLYKSGICDFKNLDTLNLQIQNCTLCSFKNSAKNTIIGFGNKNSKIAFVTLEPNASEDESGELLSGAVADKLCFLIQKSTGLKKGEFYISSLLRCKSNASADIKDNCYKCMPYLTQELGIINPKIVVALGEEVFLNLYNQELKNRSFDSIRGSFLNLNQTILMPTYSISKIIKNPSLENIFLTDLNKLKGLI